MDMAGLGHVAVRCITVITVVFFTITQSWQWWHYCQLCIHIYLQFSSLFAPTVLSKCEIRNQGVHEDYISRLNALLEYSSFNGRAKTKLAMLAFLYCVEFVKNSSDHSNRFHQRFIQNLVVLSVLITLLTTHYFILHRCFWDMHRKCLKFLWINSRFLNQRQKYFWTYLF